MTWLDQQDPVKVDAAMEKFRASPAYERIMRYVPGDDQGRNRFGLWLALADTKMMRRFGIGIFDIGDWMWRDAYDDGMSPSEALASALEADDTYSSMFGGGE